MITLSVVYVGRHLAKNTQSANDDLPPVAEIKHRSEYDLSDQCCGVFGSLQLVIMTRMTNTLTLVVYPGTMAIFMPLSPSPFSVAHRTAIIEYSAPQRMHRRTIDFDTNSKNVHTVLLKTTRRI